MDGNFNINTIETQPNTNVYNPQQEKIVQPVDEQRLAVALTTLNKYKEGKANLDERVRSNNEWWRLRNYERIKRKDGTWRDPTTECSSAWLFNGILTKHADAMDSYPEFNCLPREESDKLEAQQLTSILPVVLEENNFEKVYSQCWYDKLHNGTGIYGVFWNGNKLNGLGDIDIVEINVLNLYWQPGIEDIQDSANVFLVQLMDRDELIRQYPFVDKKNIGGRTFIPSEYDHDDNIDNTDKVEIVNWYYKMNGVLHYCKFVNNVVLFSTENQPQMYPNGIYDHNKYPFVFDVMYPIKDSPCGFGYIDTGKQAQTQIDKMNDAIVKNALISSKPRFMVSKSAGVNIDDIKDLDKDFIEVAGMVDDKYIKQITTSTLSDIYVNILNNKIDELKETTGNRDVNQGGVTGGVTTASGIASMQEASGKLSRDMIKASYRSYKEVITLCIELIRQFYDAPRTFRIMGAMGMYKYITFTNDKLKGKPVQLLNGEVEYKQPFFDIEVTAQKASPYTKMSQNELALQLYQLGFFNPQFADSANLCLEMMDFKGKDEVQQKIQQNGTMFMMLQQANARIGNLETMMGIQPQASGEKPELSSGSKESKITENARERTAQTTEPR